MSNTALKFITKYQPCPNCGSSDARSLTTTVNGQMF